MFLDHEMKLESANKEETTSQINSRNYMNAPNKQIKVQFLAEPEYKHDHYLSQPVLISVELVITKSL